MDSTAFSVESSKILLKYMSSGFCAPGLLFAAAFYGFFAIGLHAVVNYLTGLARARHLRAAHTTPSSTPVRPRDQLPPDDELPSTHP